MARRVVPSELRWFQMEDNRALSLLTQFVRRQQNATHTHLTKNKTLHFCNKFISAVVPLNHWTSQGKIFSERARFYILGPASSQNNRCRDGRNSLVRTTFASGPNSRRVWSLLSATNSRANSHFNTLLCSNNHKNERQHFCVSFSAKIKNEFSESRATETIDECVLWVLLNIDWNTGKQLRFEINKNSLCWPQTTQAFDDVKYVHGAGW